MIFAAIDPSINNIGLAILQTHGKGEVWLNRALTFYPDEEDKIADKVEKAFKYFVKNGWVYTSPPMQLIMEYPQYMTAQRGIIAAQKGYTLDLAFICGLFQGLFQIPNDDVFLYTPQQWLGNRPKTATEAKFKRVFPHNKPESEHSTDAAMLGYYHLKKMKYIIG